MCGIVAFQQKTDSQGDPNDSVNETILKFLTLAQDSRGRDNCGVMYTHRNEAEEEKIFVELGWPGDPAGDSRTFSKFCENRWENMKEFSPLLRFIGHSRKASSGSLSNYDNAHPFIVPDPNNPKRKLIGVHNGTLYLWERLMKNLGVDIKASDGIDVDCDSHALFKAIAMGPEMTERVLSNYDGAATLVWMWSDQLDTMYLWCGATSSLYSSSVLADRPLHVWETTAGLYISSELAPLVQAEEMTPNYYTYESPTAVSTNTLITIVNGEIESSIVIDRNDCASNARQTKSKYERNNRQTRKKETRRGKEKVEGEDNGNKPIVRSLIGPRVPQKSGVESTIQQADAGNAWADIDSREIVEEPLGGNMRIKRGMYVSGVTRMHTTVYLKRELILLTELQKEFDKLGYAIVNRRWRSSKGLIFYRSFNNSKMYSTAGSKEYSETEHGKLLEMFFYKGVLLKDEESFMKLTREIKKCRSTLNATTGFIYPTPAQVCNYAKSPVWIGVSNPEKFKNDLTFLCPSSQRTSLKEGDSTLFNGVHKYQFTNVAYLFNATDKAIRVLKCTDRNIDLIKDNPEEAYECKRCDRVIAGSVDCITCGSGIHNIKYGTAIKSIEPVCQICQTHKVSRAYEICTDCTVWGKDKYSAKIHPLDLHPAMQSLIHNVVIEDRKKEADEIEKSKQLKFMFNHTDLHETAVNSWAGKYTTAIKTLSLDGFIAVCPSCDAETKVATLNEFKKIPRCSSCRRSLMVSAQIIEDITRGSYTYSQ